MKMKDQNEPATKGDIAELRQELEGQLRDMRRENTAFHKELMEQLGVIDEKLRHDVLGAGNDRVESLLDSRNDHEQRIQRLEQSAGLIAA